MSAQSQPSAWHNTPFLPTWERYSVAPAGFEDHWYIHYYEISVAGNTIFNRQPLQIDTDADFYWRALMGNQPQTFALRFWDAWGNKLADQLDYQEQITPNIQPGMFFPESLCPAGSTPSVDIQNYSKSTSLLKIALIGVKRYRSETA